MPSSTISKKVASPLIGTLALLIWFGSGAWLRADAPKVRMVALGDSITRGVRPGVKAEETFAALLQADLRKQKIETEVLNLGIGGERTDQALQRLAKAVIAAKPKLVAIMYGTNDCHVDQDRKESRLSAEQYAANLKELVAQLRKNGIEPILMTPPRWGDKAGVNGVGEHPNVRLEKFVRVCREVARETKTPLVDHYAHWSKAADDGVDVGGWTTDQCHPNPRGHREIVNLLLPVVLEQLRTGPTKQHGGAADKPAFPGTPNLALDVTLLVPRDERYTKVHETMKKVQAQGATHLTVGISKDGEVASADVVAQPQTPSSRVAAVVRELLDRGITKISVEVKK